MTGLAITLLILGAGLIALGCYLINKPTSWDEHEDYEDREG